MLHHLLQAILLQCLEKSDVVKEILRLIKSNLLKMSFSQMSPANLIDLDLCAKIEISGKAHVKYFYCHLLETLDSYI